MPTHFLEKAWHLLTLSRFWVLVQVCVRSPATKPQRKNTFEKVRCNGTNTHPARQTDRRTSQLIDWNGLVAYSVKFLVQCVTTPELSTKLQGHLVWILQIFWRYKVKLVKWSPIQVKGVTRGCIGRHPVTSYPTCQQSCPHGGLQHILAPPNLQRLSRHELCLFHDMFTFNV